MFMTHPNPRRTPPVSDAKVTQDGRKRQKLSHSPEQDLPTAGPSADAPTRLDGQESGSSDHSASKWFQNANKNVSTAHKDHNELDDEPPFYMSNHANYIPPSFIASDVGRRFGLHAHSKNDSENEDLRGVIDDLTIENKRLKQMIRMQHSRRNTPSSDHSQQQDKLFEIRMLGLPSEKRRELEYLLKNFATSVHNGVPSKPMSSTGTSNATSPTGQNAAAIKTDSGYASNSTSGRQPSLGGLPSALPKSSTTKAVKSYLQDIPDTLLPKQNPVMSERAKSALVVRRLEQLFTGRKAGPGDHGQPMQQQEISQNAARIDRMQDARNNKRKRPEGNREAHVYPPDTKVNLDVFDGDDGKETAPLIKLRSENTAEDSVLISRPGSPDQRPTRPLDLDIHRAQIAAENIQYIRHLGISFPQLEASSKNLDDNPWIYLNLLTGLAQIHTLNVTPDFVRRAVKKLSKQFELSKDGHKVRWVGGDEGTKFATEDERAIEAAETSPQNTTEESSGSGGSSKRSNTNSASNAAVGSTTPSEDKTSGLQTSSDSKQHQLTTSGTSNMPSTDFTKPTTVSTAFDYKPIVYRIRAKIEDDELLRDSDESFDSQSGDSSGLAHALSKSNLEQKGKEEGSITFYNNANFFSDYSSEPIPSNMSKHQRVAIVGEIIGIPVPIDGSESPLRYHDATYFFTPKPQYSTLKEESSKINLNFPRLETIHEAGEHETVPMDMAVCGLGGIYPEDNFALDVRVVRKEAPASGPGMIRKQLPFSGRRVVQKYVSTTQSCRKIQLLPSKLPPPSYIFLMSSSSSDAPEMEDISDGDSDGSSSPLVDEEFPAPPAFLMQFSGNSGESNGDDDDDESKSSEIDMLALARRVNPRQIAEQEREYLINEPMTAQRAVAGSLAATVGASQSSYSNHDFVLATSSVASTQGDLGSVEFSGSDDEDMDDA